MQVNDTIQVLDMFDSKKVQPCASGVVKKLTDKYVHVNVSGATTKFHRSTGLQVGFSWPYAVWAIKPI